jgi:hypothetical protein
MLEKVHDPSLMALTVFGKQSSCGEGKTLGLDLTRGLQDLNVQRRDPRCYGLLMIKP